MSTREPSESAHAKVNLVLEVRGRRLDGFHELFTIFDELELADTLRLRDASTPSLVVEGEKTHVPDSEQNLVLRAARLFAARFDVPAGGAFTLEKRIPAGGGLGGGSSDAAAALRLLADRHGIDRHAPELMELARTLGADVAFFLVGHRAWADGRGDRIHPLREGPGLSYVLLLPGYPCPTADVFRAHAGALTASAAHLSSATLTTAGPEPADAARAQRCLESLAQAEVSGAPCSGLSNDLAEAAMQVAPALARLWCWLAASEFPRFHLSGSGSTLFAPFLQEERAQRVADALRGAMETCEDPEEAGLGSSARVLSTRSRHRESPPA